MTRLVRAVVLAGRPQSHQSSPPVLTLGNRGSRPPSAFCGRPEEVDTMEACIALDRAVLVDRVRGALWGTLIADAVSMPVHWCAQALLFRHLGRGCPNKHGSCSPVSTGAGTTTLAISGGTLAGSPTTSPRRRRDDVTRGPASASGVPCRPQGCLFSGLDAVYTARSSSLGFLRQSRSDFHKRFLSRESRTTRPPSCRSPTRVATAGVTRGAASSGMSSTTGSTSSGGCQGCTITRHAFYRFEGGYLG